MNKQRNRIKETKIMGKKKTGGYRAATKTYRGSRSGTQAQGTTGGSSASQSNNPSAPKNGGPKANGQTPKGR